MSKDKILVDNRDIPHRELKKIVFAKAMLDSGSKAEARDAKEYFDCLHSVEEEEFIICDCPFKDNVHSQECTYRDTVKKEGVNYPKNFFEAYYKDLCEKQQRKATGLLSREDTV